MKSLSIRTTLGLIIGLLGLLLVVFSISALNTALERNRTAHKVAQLAPISQNLFRSLQQHRLERGNILINLRADAPATKQSIDEIAAQRDGTREAFNAGYNALAAIPDLPGAAQLLLRLKSTHDAVEVLRPKVFTAMTQPKAQRDVQVLQEWPRVTQSFLDTVQETSDFLESSAMLIDPVVDQLLSVKQNAWTIRANAGSMVLRLLTTMSADQVWSTEDIIAYAEDDGRTQTAWNIVSAIGARIDTPPAVAEAINKAKAFFSGPLLEERKLIAKAFSSGQKSPVPQAKYQEHASADLSMLNAVANAALDVLVIHADKQAAEATRSLVLNGVLLAVAVAFTAIGFLIVQWRVSGPIQHMTAAMQRLANRELSVEIPHVDRGAEIGQMAKAVQVFKDNMIAREEAEAQIARQREEDDKQRREREAREKAAGEEIAALVSKVAAGDLSGRIDESGKEGFFLATSQQLNRLTATLQTMTNELADTAGAMANGDLTRSVKGNYHGVFGQLKEGVNGMAGRLRDFANRLTETAQSVKIASAEISAGSQDLAQRTESQAASIEETAASMHEITATVKQNADNAQAANQLAIAARDTAEKGGTVVADAVAAVSRIEESAQKISDIVSLIDEIAFQTNLLALNASVEAARAGEAGKGFAVVAQEVRALAQRSANASKDIKALITESNQQVKTGATLVGQTGGSLQEIVNAVKKVADIVAEIAAASREQAMGLEQINTAVASMDEMTQRNGALVEETSASAQALASQAQDLAGLVAFFRTGNETVSAAPARIANTNAAPAAARSATQPAEARKIEPSKTDKAKADKSKAEASEPEARKAAPAAKPAPAPQPKAQPAALAAPAASNTAPSFDDDDWQEF